MSRLTGYTNRPNDDISILVQEYRSVLEHTQGIREANGDVDCERLTDCLCANTEWTDRGAEHVALVQQNGTFVLRNALALAVALNVEDGTLGL